MKNVSDYIVYKFIIKEKRKEYYKKED